MGDVFPHYSNRKLMEWIGPERRDSYQNMQPFQDKLAFLGQKAYSYGLRVTFHPNEFACISSPREDVVELALEDLKWQALMIEKMEAGDPSKP